MSGSVMSHHPGGCFDLTRDRLPVTRTFLHYPHPLYPQGVVLLSLPPGATRPVLDAVLGSVQLTFPRESQVIGLTSPLAHQASH